MVLGTVVKSEGEVVIQEIDIICLTNSCNMNSMEGDFKPRLLGSIKLLIVVNKIQVSRGDASLFDALEVRDGSSTSLYLLYSILLNLTAPKISGQTLTKVKNGSTMNIFYRKSGFQCFFQILQI